jgi:3-methyl-2-oxobutanoate hydroxymethyltransferase
MIGQSSIVAYRRGERIAACDPIRDTAQSSLAPRPIHTAFTKRGERAGGEGPFVHCSLFPVPCSPFPVLRSLFVAGTVNREPCRRFPLSPTGPNAIFSLVNRPSITPATIRSLKGRQPIAALTTYDYPLTRLLDEAGIPLLLVGDSLGMVVLGYPDTTHVTMADMEHHVRAAARAQPTALLAADLPYRACTSPELAVDNARRLVAAGAQAVKAEGGRVILDSVRAILAAGIPFLGHLGMLPQNVLVEGGYHIKGRTPPEKQDLLADAHALAEAGAFAIVLELVTPPVAREITRSISIPTIGIGSGPDCDGQILVTHDLIGLFPWFTPRHVQPRVQSGAQIRAAVQAWQQELKQPT